MGGNRLAMCDRKDMILFFSHKNIIWNSLSATSGQTLMFLKYYSTLSLNKGVETSNDLNSPMLQNLPHTMLPYALN